MSKAYRSIWPKRSGIFNKTLIASVLACVISSGFFVPTYAVELMDSYVQKNQAMQEWCYNNGFHFTEDNPVSVADANDAIVNYFKEKYNDPDVNASLSYMFFDDNNNVYFGGNFYSKNRTKYKHDSMTGGYSAEFVVSFDELMEMGSANGLFANAYSNQFLSNYSSVNQGVRALAKGNNSVALGTNAVVNEDAVGSLALGSGSNVSSEKSVALGLHAVVNEGSPYSAAIGFNSSVTGDKALALGANSIASGSKSVVLGSDSFAYGNNALALGSDSFAHSYKSVAIGGGTAKGNYGASIAIGDNSQALKDNSIAIGSNSYADGSTSLSLGNNSKAYGYGSVSLGNALTGLSSANSTEIPTNFNIAIGENAKAYGLASISLGEQSLSYNPYSVAVGKEAFATGQSSSAFGNNSKAYGSGSTAIGGALAGKSFFNSDETPSNQAVAVGYLSVAAGNESLALGIESKSYGVKSVAIAGGIAGKPNVTSTDKPTNYNIAVGGDSIASKVYSTAIGNHSIATGDSSTSLGYESRASGSSSIALGRNSKAFGTFSVALGGGKAGNQAESPTGYNVALGFNATASHAGSVALGNESVTSEDNSISVGNSSLKRKISNVKAGTLSSISSDAVTGAQLYATNQNVSGFASDINRNKENIRELNTSVTAALSSVSSTSTLVDTINNLKADASLNNLTAAGKNVIATAAVRAVQEYMSANPPTIGLSNANNTLPVMDAGNGSLYVGEGSTVTGNQSIAIGTGNQVNANNAGAFGDPSIINADGSYVLGNDDTVNTGAVNSFIVGNDSVSDAEGSLLMGSRITSTGRNGVALGNDSRVSAENAVALGYGSVADEENTLSIGNGTLKRRITNMADGILSDGSPDAVTGSQLYATNERVKANEEAITKKADVDASNIDIDKWTEKLGTGKIEEGNGGLVTGGTVYDAVTNMKDAITNASPVKVDGNTIYIGADMGGNTISVANSKGESRTITGVATNPADASSAANVGYVNAVGENIMASVNTSLHEADTKMNKIGANAAALASLTPASFEGDEKWSLAASVGHYKGETAGAVGAFYKPTENVMMNVRGAVGNGENMIGAGVAVSLNKGDIPGVTKRQLAAEVVSLKARIERLEAALLQAQSERKDKE